MAKAAKKQQGHVKEQVESRRMHERIRQYWESLKEGRRFPNESEINPAAISDVWDYCFLVNMSKGKVSRGFSYEYMGPALAEAYGVNLTGVEQCDTKDVPHVALMLRQFDEVLESGEPALHDAEFENAKRMHIKYRCCLLPMGGGKVQYILGCMRWVYC